MIRVVSQHHLFKEKRIVLGTIAVLAASCSGPTAPPESADAGLAFSDAGSTQITENCDAVEDKILTSGGHLADEDQRELIDLWVAAAPLATRPGQIYLELVEQAEQAGTDPTSSKSDVVGALDTTIEYLREIDDVTYEACGIPVYSAAAAVSTRDTAPASLPCFTFQPDHAESDDLLYGTVDCSSGAEVFLHGDGQWRDIEEAPPAPVTTTTPPPSTTRVTRTLPPTTATPATQAPVPTTSAPTAGGDPASDAPPVTNELGEIVEESTTTTLPPTPEI